MTIERIDPPLPFITPKGKGLAHFVIDYGIEHNLIWIVFMNETGECWCFQNDQIRMDINLTFNRSSTSEIKTKGTIWRK